VEVFDPRPIGVRESNDDMVVAAALGGDADFLITGDKELLALRGDSGLGAPAIVTAREFVEVLRLRRPA
jgi:predicted nucleic acid-binding protein